MKGGRELGVTLTPSAAWKAAEGISPKHLARNAGGGGRQEDRQPWGRGGPSVGRRGPGCRGPRGAEAHSAADTPVQDSQETQTLVSGCQGAPLLPSHGISCVKQEEGASGQVPGTLHKPSRLSPKVAARPPSSGPPQPASSLPRYAEVPWLRVACPPA